MLITACLRSNQWVTDLSLISGLRNFVDNSTFQKQWMLMKMHNKVIFLI